MLRNINAVSADLKAGKRFFIAGDEELLKQLPRGGWIGGSIPYFMDADGGEISHDRVFTTPVPAEVTQIKVQSYSEAELPRIVADAPENGFTVLIIPAMSAAHATYAHNAPDYDGLFLKPILGWISGVHLDSLGKRNPIVVDGQKGNTSDSMAVAMHCTLPEGKTARIGIVNPFRPGSGDVITFPESGFTVRDCFVNGAKTNFATYLAEKGIDTQLPLVADYSGAMINVSIQTVANGKVDLYAPVFDDVEYRFAEPVTDYVKAFNAALPHGIQPHFTCNCILNFLYSNLEGQKTGALTGPITFGEIAYQLLNQTLVYLEIV